MKRFVWLVPLGLATCFWGVSLASSPALGDHGGGNQGGGNQGGGNQNGRGQREVRLRTNLTGDPIDGMTPKGRAEFRSQRNEKQLKVEVEDVNLDDDTMLDVEINGDSVGMITLRDGKGELERNNRHLPAVQDGDEVTVSTEDGEVVVSGTF